MGNTRVTPDQTGQTDPIWPKTALADPNADQNPMLQQQAAQLLQLQQQSGQPPQPDQDAQNGYGEGGSPLDMSHPNNIEGAAAAVHHSRLAGMLSKVGGLLGGNTSYKLVQNPDGSVDVNAMPSTPAEKWARVAQAAVEGMAHGWAAGQGPGGMGRALAAGVDTGTKLAADRQQQARDLSQQYTTQNRQKQLFDANMKLMVLNTAKAIYNQDRQQHLDQSTDDDRINAINQHNLDAHGTQHVFDTQEDLAHAYNDPNSDVAQAELEHRANIFHVPVPGKPERAIVNITPANHMHDLVPEDWTPRSAHFDPNDLGKGITYTDDTDRTVLGNSWTREKMNAAIQQKEDANEQVKTQFAQAKQAKADKEQQVRVQNATIGREGAEANLARAQAEALGGGTPGGAAQPLSDWDFPAASNFQKGTVGINPPSKGGNKIPADLNKAYRLSQIMKESGANIQNILSGNQQFGGQTVRGEDILGRLQGFKTLADVKAGLTNSPVDQATSALIGSAEQYANSSAGFHSMRNIKAPERTLENMLQNERNSPEAVKTYLGAISPAITQTEKEVKNVLMYNNPMGPSEEDREAARRSAPNYASFPQAQQQQRQQQQQQQQQHSPPPPAGAAGQLRNKVTGVVDRWINKAGKIIDKDGNVISDIGA